MCEGCCEEGLTKEAVRAGLACAKLVQVSVAVLELQRALPLARVVYCSATGASDLTNLAYMTRLGLWGPFSAFKDFDAFVEASQ